MIPNNDTIRWGDLQTELNFLNKRQQKEEMSRLIDDEVLNTIAVIGTPEEVVDSIRNRFGDIISRTGFSVPTLPDEDQANLVNRLK